MCFLYDEYCEFMQSHVVAPRRQRRCPGCYAAIETGELAKYTRGKFAGEFFYYYSCGACQLTIYRLHLEELALGCRWHESWIAIEELVDYCRDVDYERSTSDEGQTYFRWQKEAQRLIAEARRQKFTTEGTEKHGGSNGSRQNVR